MRHDNYPALVRILVATAVIGLAVKYEHLYLFHVVLGIVLLRSVLITKPGTLLGQDNPGSKYHLFFAGMFLWFALGLIWSWDRPATLRYLAYLGIGGSLSVVIVKYIGTSGRRFEDLFAVARTFFLLDIGLSLLEVLTPLRLPVSPFSPTQPDWDKLADLSAEQIATAGQCPTGFHWNPNNLSGVMIILLPFFLFHRRLLVRFAGTLVIGVLIYFARSRGCIASMAFVLFVMPLYKRRTAVWFVVLLTLAVLSYAYLSGLSEHLDRVDDPRLQEVIGTIEALRMYVSTESLDEKSSIAFRRRLIANGLAALHSTHGLGVGGGAADTVQMASAQELRGIQSMHNFWIELLVNGGYPFFILFVAWYGKLAYELLGYCRRFPPGSTWAYYSGALSLAMVGFVPGAISASTAVYILPFYILVGMAIAMVNVCRRQLDTGGAGRPGDRIHASPPRPKYLSGVPERSLARR